MFDENNVTPYFWNYRVNTFNKTRICNNARVEQYQLYYMLYFMILTILQSSWSSLQKVFCASSCRTLHWIVLPSSIDLHYPHTVNKRTYSLSLSFPVWMCWIALTEIHHNYSQKLMQKKSVWQDVSVVCSPKAFLNWMFLCVISSYILCGCIIYKDGSRCNV